MPKTPKWNEGPCPYCKEPVAIGASKCPHCQSELSPEQQQALKSQQKAMTIGCGTLALALIGGVWACSGGKPAENASSSSADAAATWTDVVPETPAANFAEHRKGVYYYAGAVSENDKANGRAAADVVGFRYLGKNAEGEHRLAVTDGSLVATCGDPCSIIHLNNGESISFSPDSIIGQAFTDALNGHLATSGGSKGEAK